MQEILIVVSSVLKLIKNGIERDMGICWIYLWTSIAFFISVTVGSDESVDITYRAEHDEFVWIGWNIDTPQLHFTNFSFGNEDLSEVTVGVGFDFNSNITAAYLRQSRSVNMDITINGSAWTFLSTSRCDNRYGYYSNYYRPCYYSYSVMAVNPQGNINSQSEKVNKNAKTSFKRIFAYCLLKLVLEDTNGGLEIQVAMPNFCTIFWSKGMGSNGEGRMDSTFLKTGTLFNWLCFFPTIMSNNIDIWAIAYDSSFFSKRVW